MASDEGSGVGHHRSSASSYVLRMDAAGDSYVGALSRSTDNWMAWLVPARAAYWPSWSLRQSLLFAPGDSSQLALLPGQAGIRIGIVLSGQRGPRDRGSTPHLVKDLGTGPWSAILSGNVRDSADAATLFDESVPLSCILPYRCE